jgi:cell division protein FtsZ
VDQRLDGQIRVTVIATGFHAEPTVQEEPEAEPAAQEPQAPHGNEKQPEFINLDTWNNLTRPSHQDDLFADQEEVDDQLGIPAILRQRRVGGKRN